MNEYEIKIDCDICKITFLAKTTLIPSGKVSFFKGFMCADCLVKQQRLKYWSDLGEDSQE